MDPEEERIAGIVRSLMLDLEKRGLLKRPAISRKNVHIFIRLFHTRLAFLSVRKIRDDPAEYRALLRKVPRLSEWDWDEILSSMLLYHILQSYEFVTKALIEELDLDKLGLRRSPMMLDILRKLGGTAECGRFESLLNRGLRNALAHGDYWIGGLPSGRRLVYDGAPPGGLAMQDLDAESRRIHGRMRAPDDWQGDRMRRFQAPRPPPGADPVR